MLGGTGKVIVNRSGVISAAGNSGRAACGETESCGLVRKRSGCGSPFAVRRGFADTESAGGVGERYDTSRIESGFGGPLRRATVWCEAGLEEVQDFPEILLVMVFGLADVPAPLGGVPEF